MYNRLSTTTMGTKQMLTPRKHRVSTYSHALMEALDSGHVAGAGLDVFVGEPKPRVEVVRHPRVSLSPHIGAATGEAQERIGLEIAAIVEEISAKQPA